MTKRHLAENLAKFYVRYGRGQELTSFILNAIKLTAYFGVISYLFERWFGLKLDGVFAIILAIFWVVGSYAIGHLDEKLGFWKIQSSYTSKELNPFWEDKGNKIDQLYENLTQTKDKKS